MSEFNFRIGDWVINDYEIAQITEMNEGRITEISTGHMRGSSHDFDCRPLTLQNKVIAESFQHWRDELYKVPGHNSFNWPDIHRYLSAMCLQAIDEAKHIKPDEKIKTFERVENFIRELKEKILKIDKVDGVMIFR